MGKTEYLLITIVFNLFFLLFMVAIITYMLQYKKKKKESEILLEFEKSKHQRELLASQLEMQQQTMQEIGREIHDNIGQKLTLASLYIQGNMYENKTLESNENLQNISNIINESLSDLRQLSKTLTDDAIAKRNIVALLQLECEKVSRIKKCLLNHYDDIDKIEISYHLKSMLLRIAQEFIQNSLKHSECEGINLHLSHAENFIVLNLIDDGKGFDVSNPNTLGIGLQNMKKRTESVGGTFLLESSNTGTHLTLKFPIIL